MPHPGDVLVFVARVGLQAAKEGKNKDGIRIIVFHLCLNPKITEDKLVELLRQSPKPSGSA
jgi:hypothetical protein